MVYMKKLFLLFVFLLSGVVAFAQDAEVAIKLSPAGSFKVKSKDVRGFATQVHGSHDGVEAKNIVVGLKNIETGISLRDQHTKKHLEVEKYPEAVLVSANGSGGKGHGVIRIKGIENKIEGTYKIEGSNLVAQFNLKLSDFKISGIKYMGVGVVDDAGVTITVPLKKSATASLDH